MNWPRLRLIATNLLIGGLLFLVVVEALPLSPPALQERIQPAVRVFGLQQNWDLFAPVPDKMNVRYQAEIEYADGQTAAWHSPECRTQTLWERWTGHRRGEWLDNISRTQNSAAWPTWARQLAQAARPNEPQAARGATVKIIIQERPTRSPELKPWRARTEPSASGDAWTLTIEKLP